MRARWSWLVGLTLAAVALAATPAGRWTPDAPVYPSALSEEGPVAVVVGVVDGDTVELSFAAAGLTVEADLAGLRAPGLRQPFGQEAAWLLRTLANGEEVRIEWADGGEADERGRRRAMLERVPDGLNLNIEMVRAGLAEPRAGAGMELDAVLAVYAERAEALGRGMHGEALATTVDSSSKQDEPASDEPGEQPAAEDADDEPAAGGDAEEVGVVYVTRSGSRYHRQACRFVSENAQSMPLEEAKQRYEPCRVCRPGE